MLRVRTAIAGFVGGPGLITHYFLAPTENGAAAQRVVDLVRAQFTAALSGVMPNSVSFTTSTDVDVLLPTTGQLQETLVVTAPANLSGTGGEGQGPGAIAALLQYHTALFTAGHRVAGRAFVSPLASATISTDGQLTNTARNSLGSIGGLMLGGLAVGDQWVVWHRPRAERPAIGKLKLLPATLGLAAPITSVTVPFKLAVLTSRRD